MPLLTELRQVYIKFLASKTKMIIHSVSHQGSETLSKKVCPKYLQQQNARKVQQCIAVEITLYHSENKINSW